MKLRLPKQNKEHIVKEKGVRLQTDLTLLYIKLPKYKVLYIVLQTKGINKLNKQKTWDLRKNQSSLTFMR